MRGPSLLLSDLKPSGPAWIAPSVTCVFTGRSSFSGFFMLLAGGTRGRRGFCFVDTELTQWLAAGR